MEAAQCLLDRGHAYPCYLTKEELDAERKEAERPSGPMSTAAGTATPLPRKRRACRAQRPAALRLKVPLARMVVIEDLIRGHVEWQTDLLGDPVILRPDGRALYNFATVVDDVAMKITHVVRAAEHLSNTPIQVLVYEALEYPTPHFAHVPVVNEPNSKKKLSNDET